MTCSPPGKLRSMSLKQLGSACGHQPLGTLTCWPRLKDTRLTLMWLRGGRGRLASFQGSAEEVAGRAGVYPCQKDWKAICAFACLINHSLPYSRT